MSHSPVQTAGTIITPIVTVAALAWGGRPERLAAIASFAAYLISPFAQRLFGVEWPLRGVALVDGTLCVSMVFMALRFNRNWLLLAAGVEVATVMAHLGVILDLTQAARGYVISLWIFYFIFLGALVFGLAEVRQRRARGLEA